MVDVLHYYFEEDMRFSTAEQADAQNRVRETVYRDFYNMRYPYANQSTVKNFDIEEEEEEVTPFDPMQKQVPTKPFIAPTQVNAAFDKPFGSLIDAPLEH